MADDSAQPTERPDIILVLQDSLPSHGEIEAEARAQLGLAGPSLAVIRQPGGPYAGVEHYLPSAIALFVTAAFFNGLLQEAGKDAYVRLKAAAKALWKLAAGLNVTLVGSSGKASAKQRYSLAYSIKGEIASGLIFKFLVQTEISVNDAEAGIVAFIDLIDDLVNGRVGEEDVKSLLTYKPVGGTVLVTFDAATRRIVPVNGFNKHVRQALDRATGPG